LSICFVVFYLSLTRDQEAVKRFLKKALANRDNRRPCVFARDGLRSYPAAIRELQREDLMLQGPADVILPGVRLKLRVSDRR
jgi:transposase-like protein